MPEPIAIVGMAAVFPGAPDLDAYWANLARGVDAVGAVPVDRLDPVFMAGFTCKRGGFIAPVFDPIAFGIMPIAAASAEPDQLLALHVAAAALLDAGNAIARARTGVILGRGGYLTPGMARLANRVRTTQQLVTTLHELLPDLDAAVVDKIRDAFRARAGESGGEAGIGLVPNLAASRIANRLDLRGPAYTVDAACASSLLAIDQGCRELADRRCDAIVAGGVHVCHDVTLWSVFSELGALSPSSAIRPFDRRADGIVIGEGAGVVVLKRLADAERDGDRVYAVIRGCGVSSDGRESSAMRPRADGQLAALEGAWRAAELDPATVGLVEAHGTATPTGDEIELEALGRFFGDAGGGARAGLGSVKSMIGHAMPAAGAAGIIKAALAVHHGVVPPSLHCDEPHAGLGRTRFRVLAAAEDWPDELPRRAGVSAFGFGGINAHVVVEAHGVANRARRFGVSAPGRQRILAVSGATVAELRDALGTPPPTPTGGGAMRMAIVNPTPERIAMAHKVLDRGKAWRGNHDIWFTPRALAADGGKLALLFPGVEATFAADVGDVARELGVALPPTIATANAAAPNELEARGRGVFAVGRLLATALARLGVAPDAIAGHSMGEWTGMVASEMIPPAAIDAFLGELPASLDVPDVVFAAVGCGAAGALAALDGLDHISVSHDNCPHQSILCGRRDRVRVALDRLAQRGVLCQELPFRSGFHSPLFADYLAPHRARLGTLPLQRPRIPLWSATTASRFPDAPEAIRALAIAHLVQPVRFRELIDALYADGVRAFVQVGVGTVTGFVDDTLRGRDYTAIAAASAKHAGMAQLARVCAALWADGFIARAEPRLASAEPTRAGMALALGVPLVKLGGLVPAIDLGTRRGDRTASPSAADAAGDPVLAELLATLDEAAASARAVVDAYRARGQQVVAKPAAAPPPLGSETTKRTMSVDAEPALLDHCFYRQPPAWPTVSDRYPVVPMTMTIGMMLDAAVRLAPGRVAIAIEDVRAMRWLAVAPPVDIELVATRAAADRIDVELPGYARATIVLADRYPEAPPPALAPLRNPRAAPFTAERMYADRWMFHGPRYQGVTTLGPLGDDGVDGAIEVLPAPGALLDCAGQLMGWWVMHTEARDRLAMPVRIARISLFAPHPAVGARVACCVRVRHVGEQGVRADLELSIEPHRHAAALPAGDKPRPSLHGRVWAKIDSWEDRRFDSDGPVWDVLMYPEANALAVAQPGGYVVVTEHWRGAASRELMMRRYLGERERADHDKLGPRARRGWLLGRIAVKDAVRMQRWAAHGASPIWPVEVAVRNTAIGQPIVDGMHVSIAHKDDRAVAIVDPARAVGIDIERIEPRSVGFLRAAYTTAELAFGSGDAHLARLWAAKEAVGKARGTGVTDPKRLEARATSDGRLAIGDAIIDTHIDGDHVIAWTKL